MTFDEVLAQVLDLLQRQGRVSYRALKVRFSLDDDHLEALKDELIYARQVAVDEEGRVLVRTEDTGAVHLSTPPPAREQARAPLAYTPSYLAEKILISRPALEGERKQVTVLFADIKDSTELIKDLDPEAAQQLLDPAIHTMMDAVHRFEGTVNQVLGDGIMALFGAPIAHEDHALRACYAALAMQAAMRDYTEEVRRTQGPDAICRTAARARSARTGTGANQYGARPSGGHCRRGGCREIPPGLRSGTLSSYPGVAGVRGGLCIVWEGHPLFSGDRDPEALRPCGRRG
jgi:Adenylate and Guanylate cyclase catalytic domain